MFSYATFTEAKGAAHEHEKMIFIDFYAEWCGPCKAMENTVFTKAEVGVMFNEDFVNFKIDTEVEEGKKLVRHYGVQEFPTYLFVNTEGEIVHKVIGFQSVRNLLAEANKAKRKFEDFVPIRSLDSVYEKGNDNVEFLYEYLKRKSYEEGSQPKVLAKYLEVVPESEFQTEKVLSLISDNVSSVSSKGFHILAKSLSKFMKLTESQQKYVLKGISNAKKFTFREAVENRDDELFDVLIDAVHGTSYSMQAAFAEERQFRYDYAKLTRNFKHFKLIAQEEATQIMGKSLEDFEEHTKSTIEAFKVTAKEKGISESSGRYQMMLAGLENGASKAASFQLNDFARGYYEMASDEIDFKNAITWSAFAIKLDETPANWETYAFLLKKVGRTRDAKKAMKQAIKIAKKENLETVTLKQAFKNIK
ncbi:thioredoxin family protein [uncultured Arcticibacterium sp.]|uniref:thioredoxin family protein n=1 Tax=uncultured Arcticibacterium sp. TaxID=2173042 RepID=UPI0030F5D1E6